MSKQGAPSKYKQMFDNQAYKLCLLGATDEELADFFEVCEATINNWKHEYPSFLESIKKGKIEADSNIASRLYQRAYGFEHEIEELKIVPIGDYQSEVQKHTVKKSYPPDPTSAIFWLKNRQPKKWRDKQEIDQNITGEVNTTMTIEIVEPHNPDDEI